MDCLICEKAISDDDDVVTLTPIVFTEAYEHVAPGAVVPRSVIAHAACRANTCDTCQGMGFVHMMTVHGPEVRACDGDCQLSRRLDGEEIAIQRHRIHCACEWPENAPHRPFYQGRTMFQVATFEDLRRPERFQDEPMPYETEWQVVDTQAVDTLDGGGRRIVWWGKMGAWQVAEILNALVATPDRLERALAALDAKDNAAWGTFHEERFGRVAEESAAAPGTESVGNGAEIDF
jgi:hypothetical protein